VDVGAKRVRQRLRKLRLRGIVLWRKYLQIARIAKPLGEIIDE
tara:strand:- start:839 stop:967 length:129 start_codon:yes stop_codon:yes gene_type:complete